MSTDPNAPDNIVLVHGLCMTPRSWDEWVPYYEGKGYTVITPTDLDGTRPPKRVGGNESCHRRSNDPRHKGLATNCRS
jgi:hypothetical protein